MIQQQTQVYSKPYIGIPYAPLGRDPAVGLDCWGFAHHVLRNAFNLYVPSYDEESSSTDIRFAIYEVLKDGDWELIGRGMEREGDLIGFRTVREPWHIGVVVGNNNMLHMIAGANSCLERYDAMHWHYLICGFYRWSRS